MNLASPLRTINPVGPLPLIQERRCPARSVASHLTSSVSDHQIVLLQCSHTASESGEGAGRCKRTFRTHRGAKASVSGPASRVASGIYTAQGRKKIAKSYHVVERKPKEPPGNDIEKKQEK